MDIAFGTKIINRKTNQIGLLIKTWLNEYADGGVWFATCVDTKGKDTHFKKGRSGSPAGRKKKPLPLSLEEAIKLELNKEMTLTNKDGVKEKMSYYTLLARSLVQDAIKNDGPSRKILLQSKNILKCNIPESVKIY